jgi:cytochrome b6-f complex iron-sulfur subunit
MVYRDSVGAVNELPEKHRMASPGSNEILLGPARPPRRAVLDWLLGLWGAGVATSILYPVLRYLIPPELPEAATQSANAGLASTLAPDSARLVPFGLAPTIVVRTAAGEYRAFVGTCTHLACTVQYRADLQHIWCACHNGHYDLNGRNISGPPPRPLEEYDVNVRDDQIVVSRRV